MTEPEIFIPRPILVMMLALTGFAVLATGLARATGHGVTREDATGRTVPFSVAEVGEAALVARMADGRRIRLARAGENIFPRMILQGFATVRARDGVPMAAPLRLLVAADGERLVVDPATGHSVRLAAFGPDNGRSFDALLRGTRR